ncbi:MAG: dienelactone hydrolase family protein [Betaproteobacteria bacterium]|nr:MAG: dienelactone hydrolase family protein [Betaproteobacteria bacterium]
MKPPAVTPVKIPLEVGRLEGVLARPERAQGVVLFANRNGGSQQSARDNPIAAALHKSAIATLVFDLLTPVEDSRHSNRFNVDLLAERLQLATEWVSEQGDFANIPVGYFGAGTGAAAALRAAAHFGERTRAVVSQGGRLDLTGEEALAAVKAPTLLLVGGRDTSAIALNREALARLSCDKEMHVIPGAKQLSSEPGAAEQVASQAAAWFSRRFAG